MIKKIFLSGGALTLLLSPVLALSIKPKTEEVTNNSTIIYDNQFFSSYEEVMKYYFQKNPNALVNENVIGDISNAIIDYDYNILNRNVLEVYDPNLISPAYTKHSGELTTSFYEAQKSFANPIFVKEKYQGVSTTFDNPEDAKMDRQNNMLDLLQGFYAMPSPFVKGNNFKYNPLSEVDYQAFMTTLIEGLKNNQSFNTYNYQKTLTNESGDNKIAPLLTNTNWDFLEVDSEKLNQNQPWPKENLKALNSGDAKYNEQEYTHVGNYGDKDIIENTTAGEMAGNGGAFIRVYPFQNSIDPSQEAPYWEFLADGYHKADLAGGPEGEYTSVEFYDTENHKNNSVIALIDNQIEIDRLLVDQSPYAHFNVFSRSGEDNQDGYLVAFDLNKSENWKIFIKEASIRIEKLKAFFGENLEYQLKVTLNNNKTNAANKSETDLIKHFWHDKEGIGKYDNAHYVRKIDLNYFNFSLNFNFRPNSETVLINTYQKFEEYYQYRINLQGEDWGLSLYDLWIDWIKEPIIIENNVPVIAPVTQDEKNILKSLALTVAQHSKDKIDQMHETISIKSRSLDNKLVKLFNLNRSTDLNLKLESFATIEVIKKKLLAQLNLLNNNKLSSIYIDDFKLEDIISKIVDFLIYDGNITSNDWTNYNQLINEDNEGLSYVKALKALSDIDNFEIPIVLSSKDLFDAKNKKLTSVLDILQTQINNLYLYLNHFQNKNASDELEFWEDFLQTNIFVRKMRFDINHVIIPSTQDLVNISSVPVGQGQYLLLQETLANSGLIENNAQNIGEAGLFLNKNNYNTYRESIINAAPPVVRIMYNLDGEKVFGQDELIYDSEEVLLANVKNRVEVKIDPFYVYYGTNQNRKLILNQKANIYTINHLNKVGEITKRSFLNHSSAYNYLLEMLKQEMTIIK